MLRIAPQDEVLNPHGEERGNAARLETRGRVIRIHDCGQAEWAPSIPGFRGACHRAALRADPFAPSRLRDHLLNFATNSTCGVWRNWSTGVTRSSLYPPSTRIRPSPPKVAT